MDISGLERSYLAREEHPDWVTRTGTSEKFLRRRVHHAGSQEGREGDGHSATRTSRVGMGRAFCKQLAKHQAPATKHRGLCCWSCSSAPGQSPHKEQQASSRFGMAPRARAPRRVNCPPLQGPGQ
jgi:hypothetical protein